MRRPYAATSVQLPAKRADHSAAEDGALVWDRSLTAPVVTRSGAFRRLAVQVDVPATATSAGRTGDYAVGGGYLYLCTGTDTWMRVAIATW